MMSGCLISKASSFARRAASAVPMSGRIFRNIESCPAKTRRRDWARSVRGDWRMKMEIPGIAMAFGDLPIASFFMFGRSKRKFRICVLDGEIGLALYFEPEARHCIAHDATA